MTDRPHSNDASKAEVIDTEHDGSELLGSIVGNPSQNREEHYKDLCAQLTEELEKMNSKHALLNEEIESLRRYKGLYNAAVKQIQEMNANFRLLPSTDCREAINGYHITELRTLSDHEPRPNQQPVREFNQMDMAPRAPKKLRHQGYPLKAVAFSGDNKDSKRLNFERLGDTTSLKSPIQLQVAPKENIAKINSVSRHENSKPASDQGTHANKRVSMSPLPAQAIPKKCKIAEDAAVTKTKTSDGFYEDRWMNCYGELVKFKEENGHCNVPQTYNLNPSLGRWVSNQRQFHKCGDLSKERIAKLNGIGFVWELKVCIKVETKEDRWMNYYGQLVKFQEEKEHCNVPRGYKPNPSLGRWVHTQRETRKDGGMLQERVDLLNKIDFIWKVEDSCMGVAWMTRYNDLVAFKNQNGDCNVPNNYLSNPSLGYWVQTQRANYRNGDLSKERIAKLDEIGFVWVVCLKADWMTRYNDLIAYKNQHSHCDVPVSYKPLGYWVINQRTRYKRGVLPQNQFDLLTKINFRWKVKE